MIRIVLVIIFIVNIINIGATTQTTLSNVKPNKNSKPNQQRQRQQKPNTVVKDPFFSKRPADQDEYEAIFSGKKKLVTSFQITPVVATNTECLKSDKSTSCQWRELGIHERSSGFVMSRNNVKANEPSHKFAISCIICGTDALCSDPDASAMKSTIDMNNKDGTIQHHLRMDKIVTQITNKCKSSKAIERKLSMKQIHAIHEGLSSLMGLPESVGAGMVGANIGASDLLEDDRFGPGSNDIGATVQGTKSLSPVRLNNMEFGKDMNNGDVKNTKAYISPAALKKEADEVLDGANENVATSPVGKEKKNGKDEKQDASGSKGDDDNDATGPVGKEKKIDNHEKTGTSGSEGGDDKVTSKVSTKSIISKEKRPFLNKKPSLRAKNPIEKKGEKSRISSGERGSKGKSSGRSLSPLLSKRARSLLEIGNSKKTDRSTAMDFESFKANAAFVDGSCGNEGDNGKNVAVLFQNVFIGKGGKVKFSCVDNKYLCDCISKIGQSKEGVAITDTKFTFKMYGNGESCKYEIIDNSKGSSDNSGTRRKLLQRGEGGRC